MSTTGQDTKGVIRGDEVRGVLARNLKLFRARKALSQADLAEKAGISIPFLSDIERENKWPYMETLLNLASALGVEPYQLLQPYDPAGGQNAGIIAKCLDDVREASREAFDEAMKKSLDKIRAAYL